MPNALVKSFAKRSGKSVKKVEDYWDEAKKSARKKGLKKGDPGFWAYVNAIVQRRTGLHEGMSFKDFLLQEGSSDLEHKQELAKTGFYGKAGAGCIIVAESTGRICMPYRSAKVEQPHTWGTWGGAIDVDEDPKEAARREVREEAGYHGHLELSPLYTFKHPSGFKYHTFLAIVDKEFTPKLDWETEKFQWAELSKLPRPLHFGLRAVLEDAEAMKKLKEVTSRS